MLPSGVVLQLNPKLVPVLKNKFKPILGHGNDNYIPSWALCVLLIMLPVR